MYSFGNLKKINNSFMRDSNFKGQKIFSVTVTESELKLFSEFLQQKEYAVVPS